jgi:hypothetical protein
MTENKKFMTCERTPSLIMTEANRLIAWLDKDAEEEIRVHLVEWKNQIYVDIRVWYRKDDGTFGPTTKGLRFNAELLEQLRSALDAADEAIETGVEIKLDEPVAEKHEAKEEVSSKD